MQLLFLGRDRGCSICSAALVVQPKDTVRQDLTLLEWTSNRSPITHFLSFGRML